MSSVSVKRPPKASESKADLVSIEASSGSASGSNGGGRIGSEEMFTWSRRTPTEKLLVGVVAVLVVALVAVIIVAATRRDSGSPSALGGSSICNTPGCIKAANDLIQNMDDSVNPCEDFYQYACGGFEQRVRIPDDRSSRSQFAIIDDDLEQQLRDILEANITEGDSSVFVMAKSQYKSCMDTDRLEVIGLKPLRDLLGEFGGWPVVDGDTWDEDEFDWQQLNYRFRSKGYSTDYLFDFSIATDIKNSTKRVVYFDQGHLGMSREYLIKGLRDENVRHYYSYMQKIAVLLGADPRRVGDELKASLEFEIKLANISLPREERRNASKLYHPMQLSDVRGVAPIVDDWTEYINRILTEDVIQVPDSERVVVSTPGYLRNLTELLRTEPKRNVANYMMWRAARASVGFLNGEIRAIGEEFVKNVTGKTETPPRWKKCVGSAAGSFSAAVGKMYVQQHFNHKAKDSMLEMVTDVRQEFSMILDEITWMDPMTKKRAHRKLSTIKEYIGYPEEILNNTALEELYKGLEVEPTSYFQNGISMSIWSTNYHWKKLRETVDKTDWKRHANPAVVNAFYSSIENSIQFPAGILQGIFFNQDRPSYLNYGAIGWVIGHEITHGFDDQGRQYDADGNLRNWWEPETIKEFLHKTTCIIGQYGNYTAPQVNTKLNGINTQGENIADNGGIKEAYRAYQRFVKREGAEPVLPGLPMNQNQLFWLSAANTWCSKYRPKSLEQRIKTGAHSPGMFRVKGPFSNSREFSKDFQCKLGSGMNPVDKCEVW